MWVQLCPEIESSVCTFETIQNGLEDNSNSFEARVQFTCNPGTECTNGITQAVCNEMGAWNPPTLPSCQSNWNKKKTQQIFHFLFCVKLISDFYLNQNND